MSLPNWEKNYNSLQNKVDKVEGKELSTNDFTNEYKNKVDNMNNLQWHNATINSEYATGICKYLVIGNMVVISIQNLIITKKVEHNTVIISGFPTNLTSVMTLMFQYANTLPKRIVLTADGNIKDWYDPIEASDCHFYATIITTKN